jgi:hypothetical protein
MKLQQENRIEIIIRRTTGIQFENAIQTRKNSEKQNISTNKFGTLMKKSTKGIQ